MGIDKEELKRLVDERGVESLADLNSLLKDVSKELIQSICEGEMTTRDFQGYLEDLYGIQMSAQTVRNVTDSVMASAKEWQTRSLESIYSMIYLDGTFIKTRDEGRVRNVSLSIVAGINLQGQKTCLGMDWDTTECAKYWFKVLDEL